MFHAQHGRGMPSIGRAISVRSTCQPGGPVTQPRFHVKHGTGAGRKPSVVGSAVFHVEQGIVTARPVLCLVSCSRRMSPELAEGRGPRRSWIPASVGMACWGKRAETLWIFKSVDLELANVHLANIPPSHGQRRDVRVRDLGPAFPAPVIPSAVRVVGQFQIPSLFSCIAVCSVRRLGHA
jgi:hypothetical protein